MTYLNDKENKIKFLKSKLPIEDYQRLEKILSKTPSSIEITLALALWNEHCSYRSSRIHLKKFDFKTSKTVSAIGENAGIVDLGKGEKVSFKMESHNHPSYIIPYHGAATGVGGILRDVFAMNARPIALANYLCFGNPQTAKDNHLRVDGVIRGIGGYGNCVGVPNINGHTEFDSSYDKNILVNAMALGFLGSKSKMMNSWAKGVGNYVVYVGAATGRDGVLGASMASESFTDDQASKPTVQIGDPFFGKQLLEACLKVMDQELVVACQDMGAAGLTCSSFEMSEKGGLGLSLHLDRVPLRDQSMEVEDILLSESQERMLFVCEPSKYEKLKNIFEDHQLEVCVLGEVLKTPEIELYWKDKNLLKVDPKLFTSESPIENRPYILPEPAPRVLNSQFQLSENNLDTLMIKILQSPQGRSRKFIYDQFDQRVGANTVQDCSHSLSVLKLPESQRLLAIALGCRNSLMKLDVEQGAKDSIFYPALQLATRGFQPLAVTDCLNFGNPQKKRVMGEFVLSVENLAKACQILDVPVISGNVSFYNENQESNITPTPSIAMVGIKEKPTQLTPDVFTEGQNKVYLLYSHQFSFQGQAQIFFDSSQQSQKAYGALQDPLVKLFIDDFYQLQNSILFSSLFVVGKFGLAYALARMFLNQDENSSLGFQLDKDFKRSLLEERLYEVIVSLSPQQEELFQNYLKQSSLDCELLGVTTNKSELQLKKHKWDLKTLRQAYNCSWKDISL